MILYDARGNELQGNLDQVGNQTITDARVASATLGALNSEILMDLNGKNTAIFDLRTAAMNATLVFEATVDGTNYFGLPAMNIVTEAILASIVITTTQATTFSLNCAGYRRVRCRVSAYTSGNVVVVARASISEFITYSKQIPSILGVTATAAVNTASTATLPAAGAGLFHYITKIELVKLYAVVGVANGAGNIITSTNLVGNPEWTTEQRAGAAGDCVNVIDWDCFGNPIKSSVANIATTFVAPLQLQTIWRWNIQYYVGA